MIIKTAIIITLILLTGCSVETTKSDIQRTHILEMHVNGSVKLMKAEQELISQAPHAFVTYQALRHDERSYLVSNLIQAGEKKAYLIGDGFFLIDKSYVLQSSKTELVNSLIEITKDRNEGDRYRNG